MVEMLLINILLYSTLVWLLVTTVFCVAILKRDNSIMDIAYGPIFAIAAIGTLSVSDPVTPLPLLITIAITIWATRLGIRILRKNWGKPEDPRYAAWRTEWMQRGYGYFLARSYLQISLLQGLIITIVALPFIMSLTATGPLTTIPVVIGFLLFLFGLGYETTADWQLDRFLARKRAGTESAVLMTTGLFRYSRRPNYFGESLIWWGLAFTVLAIPYGYIALLSPIVITYIVTHITGPMLENLFLERYPAEYRTYMARTNYFIPGPQKH